MIKRRLTIKVFALLSLIFVMPVVFWAQDSVFELPAGTRIKVSMDAEVSSGVASVNDTFTVTVSEPVSIRGTVVLPVGAVIEGRVLKSTPAAGGGKGGMLEVVFETLRLKNGNSRNVAADMIRREKNQGVLTTLAILGGSVAGAVIGGVTRSGTGAMIGAGIGGGAGTGVALARKGREARIKTNEKFEIVLKSSVTLPVTDF